MDGAQKQGQSEALKPKTAQFCLFCEENERFQSLLSTHTEKVPIQFTQSSSFSAWIYSPFILVCDFSSSCIKLT